jgi:hypothetical protein
MKYAMLTHCPQTTQPLDCKYLTEAKCIGKETNTERQRNCCSQAHCSHQVKPCTTMHKSHQQSWYALCKCQVDSTRQRLTTCSAERSNFGSLHIVQDVWRHRINTVTSYSDHRWGLDWLFLDSSAHTARDCTSQFIHTYISVRSHVFNDVAW